MYGEGEPASPYATDHGTARKPGPWSEGEDIIPFTTDQAKQWAEKKLDPDKYEKKGLAVDKLIQKAIVIHLPKWFIWGSPLIAAPCDRVQTRAVDWFLYEKWVNIPIKDVHPLFTFLVPDPKSQIG